MSESAKSTIGAADYLYITLWALSTVISMAILLVPLAIVNGAVTGFKYLRAWHWMDLQWEIVGALARARYKSLMTRKEAK